ncbi:hypothetical protein [Moorena sp. SIO3H5]|uniref:hypothetical protein n=1 Tax=Moorena sp. SIO3H5 TaxID=2607834 RepID=UPI0013B72CEA|nr:hypothetical protein [Moorena sp. SIO3H5]NEO73753.1 hypothetical protein [Moorena sp. SIO3H5]
MESEYQQYYKIAFYPKEVVAHNQGLANPQPLSGMNQESLNPCKNKMRDSQPSEILSQFRDKRLLIVNSRRRNGLIIYKHYHAEFAGPGSAVGGIFDLDCQGVVPVGNLSLISPESAEERRRAYLIRRQWIRLTKQITEYPSPIQRTQQILEQFEGFGFDANTIAQLPDEAFALLVGVLPYTIRKVRNAPHHEH